MDNRSALARHAADTDSESVCVLTRLDFHWVVAVAVTNRAEQVIPVEPDHTHALVLDPVTLFMTQQATSLCERRFSPPVVADHDAEWGKCDSDAIASPRGPNLDDPDTGQTASSQRSSHPSRPTTPKQGRGRNWCDRPH